MIKLVPTNDCVIEVTPSAPWFRQRSADEEYRKCGDIKSEIKRHCDDIGGIFINQQFAWEDDSGRQWTRLYEALEELYAEESVQYYYRIRYERPSDNGVGTSTRADDFETLIETAWKNPWKFEIYEGPVLTEDQKKFLDRVLEASLEEKEVKEAAQ